MVNRLLVEQGYATVAPLATDTRYTKTFAAGQEQAQAKKAGLWAKCQTPLADATVKPITGDVAKAAPAYPSVSASYGIDAWHATDYSNGTCGTLPQPKLTKSLAKVLMGRGGKLTGQVGVLDQGRVGGIQRRSRCNSHHHHSGPSATNRSATNDTIPQVPQPSSSGRTGAIRNDGTTSGATGRGACSHHGGVNHWLL